MRKSAEFAALDRHRGDLCGQREARGRGSADFSHTTGTPEVRHQVASFYSSVAEMLAAWIQRRSSPHTQRAYRRDLVAFIEFQGIRWPEDAHELLRVTVPDVQAYRDHLEHELGAAPKTINRRVSSLSGFYRYMREAAAEMHLPVVVPNPAHSQFISRENQDPVRPTEELSLTQARRLMAMPEGESALAARDRAILKFYIYTGARTATGCRLLVEDLELSREDDPRIRIVEKGKGRSRRVIGVHFALAEALREYLAVAGITSGPVFRARKSARSQELGTRPMSMSSMYRALQDYLAALPGAMRKRALADGGEEDVCGYSPHTLRATTATMLLNEGVDIVDVQKLLGHKHVTTTQIYDKRRRATVESASHRLPV